MPAYDDDDDLEVQRSAIRERMDALTKERDDARAEAAEAAKLRRDLEFMRAGIDTTDPKLSYFAKGYDGDVSAAAIKQAAVEAGFLTPPQPAATPQDRQALGNMAAAGAGQGQGPIDYATAIAGATSEDEVLRLLEQAHQQ